MHLPGWSYEPVRYIAQATVHVVPSRDESGSQSAVLAPGLGVPVAGTAVDGLAHSGRGPRRPSPARGPPAPSPGRRHASWPASGPTPPSAGPTPGSSLQRSGRGIRWRLLVLVLVVWAAVLTEMAVPTGRQVTALPHAFGENGRTGPGNIRF